MIISFKWSLDLKLYRFKYVSLEWSLAVTDYSLLDGDSA